MRQVLFRIPWDHFSLGGWQIPLFGFGLLLLVWLALGAWTIYDVYLRKDRHPEDRLDLFAVGMWLATAIAILQAPVIGPRFAPEGLPIFGYGAMLLCALLSAIWLASRRAASEGIPPEAIWDLAVWLFIPGILGARLFYLVQYRSQVYAGVQTLPEFVWATINLSEGGIVLYGGLIAGAVAYFVFCALRKIRPLAMADIITPSVFVGIGFGRIGCFLNGCCFGDACSLPWAVQFPPASGPFTVLVNRGFLPPDALMTPPLHPTQLYSAFDGFLIAGLTLWYYRYRRGPGDVFALGLLVSSATRFLIEFIRGDEYGQWGTSLTISQWISLGLFATGLLLQGYLAVVHRSGAGTTAEPIVRYPTSASLP